MISSIEIDDIYVKAKLKSRSNNIKIELVSRSHKFNVELKVSDVGIYELRIKCPYS